MKDLLKHIAGGGDFDAVEAIRAIARAVVAARADGVKKSKADVPANLAGERQPTTAGVSKVEVTDPT